MNRRKAFKIVFFLSAFLFTATPCIQAAAAGTAPSTGAQTPAAETNSILLTGNCYSSSKQVGELAPSLIRNEDNVWLLTMSAGSKIVVENEAPTNKKNTPVFLLATGVVTGSINSDGCMEIQASRTGTGVVAFQYQDASGKAIGEPLQIAVHVVEKPNPEQLVEQYYKDAVFCGDSIIVGLKNYAMKNKNSFFNKAQYLSAGSYSLRYAILENNPEKLHPMYKGAKRVLWESIPMLAPKRVFLFFGLNDLNISGLSGAIDNYVILADKIKETSPDVEIHVISMTGTLAGTGKRNLTNDKIREFNGMLEECAKKQGWGYVALAPSLEDKNGDLKSDYCSDGFVHHSKSAYDQVWTSVFRDYALKNTN